MLLALYSASIERLEQALDALSRHQIDFAKPLMLRAQRMVMELFAGVDLQYGDLPQRLASLYEFVLWSISQGTATHLQSAISVLKTLHEGMEGIREQAVSLERLGEVPPAGAVALS